MKTLARPKVLALVLSLAVLASAAGLVISLRGNRAQAAAAPGSAQAQADFRQMQSALSSGSVSAQAALLPPPARFAPHSGPVFPAGTKITILPGTLRASGSHGTVTATVSGGAPVTLGLYAVQGHWRLYAIQDGTARTSAAVTPQPASAQLADVTSSAQSALAAGTYQPVILVHGFGESASVWSTGPDGKTAAGSMTSRLSHIRGLRLLKFDYGPVNGQWVTNPAIGPALADYIHAAAKAAGRPVIVVGFSMGGLATRYAATTGARAGDIAMVITIGTPNTGSLLGNAHDLFCPVAGPAIDFATHSQLCTQMQAASAMAVFNPEILTLPKLPASIPVVHAIAGDENYYWKIGDALAYWPFYGDVAVLTGSALDKRPGSANDTYDTVTNPPVPGDWSAFHLNLKNNTQVQQLVAGYIADYLFHHPLPAAQAQQPAAQDQQPLAGHPAGPDGNDPLNVIYNYYDALNRHDYHYAWNLGGSNIGGSYDSWVNGYSDTKSLYVTGKDLTGGVGQDLPRNVVRVAITATQTDGAVLHYAGTYTVDWDGSRWTIVAADIRDLSGTGFSQVAPAPTTLHGITRPPSEIVFSGDATNVVDHLSWSGWGAGPAVGTGTFEYDSCTPDCARATLVPYPAQVTLSAPVNGLYTQVTEVIESGPYAGTIENNAPVTSTWPGAS